jgi:mono/diheme cytochrome c family protein
MKNHLLSLLLVAACSQSALAQPATAAARGEAFYHKAFNVNDKMPSCAACHTDKPTNPGKHAVTGKEIKPLAPAANPDRLSDPAKVEKWFGRNCKEVVGRQCTDEEKADFLAYLKEVR